MNKLFGYDETSSLGKDLRFIRVCLNEDDELLPYLLNIIHFGSVVVTKKMLRGQSEFRKELYLKEIFENKLIDFQSNIIFMDIQLKMLVKFMHGEFFDISNVRQKLIKGVKNSKTIASLKENNNDIIKSLKRFDATPKYIDAFIKSFVYKTMIRQDLEKGKYIQNDLNLNYLVDGGYQFTFWKNSLLNDLREQGILDENISININGIANGDEYYPIINLAGNIASCFSLHPHDKKKFPSYPIFINFEEFKEFQKDYRLEYKKGIYHQRLLFIGQIDVTMQYLTPYIQIKNSDNKLHEAFRIRPPLRRFYADLGLPPKEDLIIYGNIITEKDKIVCKECEEKGLTMISIDNFIDPVIDFLDTLKTTTKKYSFGKDKTKIINKTIEKRKNYLIKKYK